MRQFRFPVVALVAAAICSTALYAQKTTQVHPGKGGSPHVRSEWVIDGANISIEYGRPSLKGRSEATLMPKGEEWRTGADEATTLRTSKALMFGSMHVNPGTYTVYTVPGDTSWQLVISKKTGQWGIPYPKGEDVGRAAVLPTVIAAPVEQLTINIEDTPKGGTLHIEWGGTRASVPFTVM